MTGDGTTRQVHGTAVAVDGRGVLLRGPSGSGKSDLALRLIDGGARLVADDRTDLVRAGGSVLMRAPAAIAGVLEVRGVGLVRIGAADGAPLCLVVDLVAPDHVPRLPPQRFCEYLDLRVPRLSLTPFEASAAAKVRVALRLHGGEIEGWDRADP
ncbi:MAG: serine/threonine protein kinase [Hyphomicrobiales bacterium]|nr:serine/threonine protein kinase [Hyphomicrobiales bacterium]MCP5374153.1 serine/threonine protein kinase [Hyphomicrobiales bacterium]